MVCRYACGLSSRITFQLLSMIALSLRPRRVITYATLPRFTDISWEFRQSRRRPRQAKRQWQKLAAEVNFGRTRNPIKAASFHAKGCALAICIQNPRNNPEHTVAGSADHRRVARIEAELSACRSAAKPTRRLRRRKRLRVLDRQREKLLAAEKSQRQLLKPRALHPLLGGREVDLSLSVNVLVRLRKWLA